MQCAYSSTNGEKNHCVFIDLKTKITKMKHNYTITNSECIKLLSYTN